MILRFHLTPIRMAKIKNSGDSTCWQGYGERRTLLHCWWDFKLVQPLWKSVWQFLGILAIVLPQDPATSFLGIYPRDSVSYCGDTCSSTFIAALFPIERKWNQPRSPSDDEWKMQIWFSFTMELYPAISKNEIMRFVGSWIELENTVLSKKTRL